MTSLDCPLVFGLACVYAPFVIMVNCAGAVWAAKTGWHYLWWMPVSCLAYLAAGYGGTSVASLVEIALAGGLASLPDTVVSSWYALRVGAMTGFESIEEYVGTVVISLPIAVLVDAALYLGGAFFGVRLLGPL